LTTRTISAAEALVSEMMSTSALPIWSMRRMMRICCLLLLAGVEMMSRLPAG
jgi:hypothetical protein